MKKIILLLSSLWASSVFADGLPTTPYVYVQGFAEERIAPDTLTVNFKISLTNKDQGKAMSAVSEKSAAVFKLFKELKIADEALTAFAISISADYDYADKGRVFNGYEVARDFSVRLTDFTQYPKLVDGLIDLHIDSLQGVTPSYSKTNIETAKLKTAALSDARKQAEEIAATLDARVSSVFAASPIAFGEVSGAIFGGSYNETVSLSAFAVAARGKGSDSYVFEKLRLSQRLHVIFLIEPNKK